MTITLQKYKKGFTPWILFHISIATIIIAIQFIGLGQNTVLLVHDQYFPLTGRQAVANLDIISTLNGGTPNGFLFAINGFDSLFFAGLYRVGLDAQQVEIVYFILLLSIALILIHFGFFRLLRNTSYVISIAPTYAFSFSPFLLVYYNTGVFWSMLNMLAIAVLPLTVAVFRDLLSSKQSTSRLRKDIALLGMCLAVYGFALYFAIPVGITLLTFLVFKRSHGIRHEKFFSNFIPVLAIAASLALAPIFAGYIERYSFGYSFIEGPLANSTSGSIQGGILTPMLQHASWAIYNFWSPRVLLGFPSHFISPPFIISALAQLAMAVVILLNFRRSGFVRACFFGLLISLFFAKGSSNPFGVIFDYALQNISILGLVRSPDSKFGLTIAFLLVAILGWGFSEFIKNKKRVAAFITLAILLSLPFLNARLLIKGTVIHGENGETSINGNYEFPIDESFMEAVNFINGLSSNSAIYFKTWDGFFNTSRGFIVIHKEPLSDFVKLPVYFNGDKSVTDRYISELVSNFEDTENFSYLRPLGIRYIVVNLLNENADKNFLKRAVTQSATEVFNNNHYIILQINGVENISPIEIRTAGGPIHSEKIYRRYLDTVYEIDPDKIRSDSFDLILKTANSRNWCAFSVNNVWQIFKIPIKKLLFNSTIKENYIQGDFIIEKRVDSGFNHWLIKRQNFIASGEGRYKNGYHEKIFLVFVPQILLIFLISFCVSILLLVIYVFYIRKPMIIKNV